MRRVRRVPLFPLVVALVLAPVVSLGHDALRTSPVVTAQEACLVFPETGHSLCHGFKDYWERYGGLAIFEYPITDEFVDPATGRVTQWFERARFEWHPGAWPERYDVLLGRLGAQLYQGVASAPADPTVVAEPGDGTVTLVWPAVPGAESYRVYMAREPGVTTENWGSKAGGARFETDRTLFTQTGLQNGHTYYFVVTAISDGIESPGSVEVTATPGIIVDPVGDLFPEDDPLVAEGVLAPPGTPPPSADIVGVSLDSTSVRLEVAAAEIDPWTTHYVLFFDNTGDNVSDVLVLVDLAESVLKVYPSDLTRLLSVHPIDPPFDADGDGNLDLVVPRQPIWGTWHSAASTYYPDPSRVPALPDGTPLAPVTDVAGPSPSSMWDFHALVSDTGDRWLFADTKYCPPSNNPPKADDPDGDRRVDWRMNRETVKLRDGRTSVIETYCMDRGKEGPDLADYFAKRISVYDINNNLDLDGFIGKCPYEGGENKQTKKETADGDFVVTWQSYDKGSRDDDQDSKLDCMYYRYSANTGRVTYEHHESSGGTTETKRSGAFDPVKNPDNIPAYGTHPDNP